MNNHHNEASLRAQFLLRLALLLLPGLGPSSAVAAWPPDGVPLCGAYPACDASFPVPCPDGTGGAFVVWDDDRFLYPQPYDIFMQRVTAPGDIALGWPATGLPVCVDPSFQAHSLKSIVPDGTGGVIVAWEDWRNQAPGGTGPDIYAQRILADGSVAPAWAVNGVPVTLLPGAQTRPMAQPDGFGGAYFTWEDDASYDVQLQRLTADGAPAAGWAENGLPICTDPSRQGSPDVTTDGLGGAIVAWADLRDGPAGVYAQRVLPSGEIAPGWPVNGARIVADRYFGELVSDGTGGAYVFCATAGPSYYGTLYLQRFSGEGTIVTGWPEGGAVVCAAPGDRASVLVTPDGQGGVYLVWADYRDPSRPDEIYVQRMRADGTRYPGWPVDGLLVTDNQALDDFPDLAPDGSGGVYLCWVQCCYGPPVDDRVVVQHLTGAAAAAPGWPAGGMVIPYGSTQPHITADGQGGAIVVWIDGTLDVRALRFVADGPTPVQVALVSAEASPERVRLAWYGSAAAGVEFAVYRRMATADWQRLATITGDGSGNIRYEDRAIMPGTRYAYRLGYPDGGAEVFTAEAWVDVPNAFALTLEGLRPNPAVGELVAAFTLPSAEPATLEVLDVNGRRIVAQEVGTLGAGQHRARLDSASRVPPGVYWLRLRQGSHMLVARGAVIR